MNGLPRSKALRQVTPRGAGLGDVHDRVHELAVGQNRRSRLPPALGGKKRRDLGPIVVGKLVAVHRARGSRSGSQVKRVDVNALRKAPSRPPPLRGGGGDQRAQASDDGSDITKNLIVAQPNDDVARCTQDAIACLVVGGPRFVDASVDLDDQPGARDHEINDEPSYDDLPSHSRSQRVAPDRAPKERLRVRRGSTKLERTRSLFCASTPHGDLLMITLRGEDARIALLPREAGEAGRGPS